MTVEKGSILIAEPFLKDPNFSRKVVIICENQTEGALGFILNQKLEYSLPQLLPDVEGHEFPVFYGGPVQVDTLHFIHNYSDLIPDATPVCDGIHWGGNIESTLALIRNGEINPDRIRFFLGYSGWGPEQLENEMKEHSWIVSTATADLVFKSPSDMIWKEALRALGGDYEMMINFPVDPLLN